MRDLEAGRYAKAAVFTTITHQLLKIKESISISLLLRQSCEIKHKHKVLKDRIHKEDKHKAHGCVPLRDQRVAPLLRACETTKKTQTRTEKTTTTTKKNHWQS